MNCLPFCANGQGNLIVSFVLSVWFLCLASVFLGSFLRMLDWDINHLNT
jgi:hypothetical protein